MQLLTKFALENSRLILLFLLIVLVAGPISFLSHPSREDPKITIRTAVITATFPGMSSERVENLITRRIEEKLREIAEIEHIVSTSRNGVATVKAEVYERYFNMEEIWTSVRNKMDDIKSDLPEGTNGPFVNDDYGNVAMATIALTGEGFSLPELRETARNLRDKLYRVKGISKIELFGIEPERIYIEINTIRLAQLGLSPTHIINTLQKQNIILPGGKIEAGPVELTIEPSGNFESVKDISSLTLEIPNSKGQVAYLRDIATIKRALVDPPEKPVFFNGKQAIIISVSMVDRYDSFKFGEDLSSEIKTLENTLPLGYALKFVTFQPKDIAIAVNGVMNNLYQTIVIVLLVVMMFLGVRTGIIVGTMVPLTMLVAILIMRYINIELERMSLATLIISLGLLVDNGIVIAESIQRKLSHGMERMQAALQTGKEMALPLLSSSITTILAFMPLMLAQSTAGEFTRSISLVIAITLLSSWVLAMTVTPLMCMWFMKAKPAQAEQNENREGQEDADLYTSGFYRVYKNILEKILSHRLVFLSSMVGLLFFSGWLFQFVPKIFFPASERAQLQVIIDHPVGHGSKATLNTVKALNSWLLDKKQNPDIANTVAYVAAGGPRFYLSLNPIDPDPHRAFILVNTTNAKAIPPLIDKVNSFGLSHLPQARLQVKPLSLGPGEIGLVEYRISGPNANILADISEQIKNAMRAIPGSRNIKDNWENRTVKVIVEVDQTRARRVGVTSQDVAQALNATLSGNAITSYREGDTTIPVVMRAEQAHRTNLDRLRTLTIPTANGSGIPLLQIANFKGQPGFALIQRRDLARTLIVSGKHAKFTAAEFHSRLGETLKKIKLPDGYELNVGGELESSSKAQGSLFANMPLAFALMVLILVAQFGSYRKALAILFVLPLSIIGVSVGLFLAPGANFGFMAILGVLSLAGIIINNAIVLIDRITIEIETGHSIHDAIINASMTRLRPILMTTATTIFGLLPIILSADVLFYDMALVISGGLLIGTLLTLGVVPVLYALFYRETKTV